MLCIFFTELDYQTAPATAGRLNTVFKSDLDITAVQMPGSILLENVTT